MRFGLAGNFQFSNCFLSVVVITCPSHGQGRRFDPGREQFFLLVLNLKFVSIITCWSPKILYFKFSNYFYIVGNFDISSLAEWHQI